MTDGGYYEDAVKLIQGAPVAMAMQLGELEEAGWEARLVLSRSMFGNRMDVWFRRWVQPTPVWEPDGLEELL